MHYSHEATAGRAPGQPMVFTASGRFESAPVVINCMEVAAAAGGGGGQSDNNVSSRADRKRRGKSLSDGPIKLVRGGGWCDNCNAAAIAIREDDDPVVENVEVAAAAGRGGGDDDDDDVDDDDDDDDDDNNVESAPVAENMEVAAAAGGGGGDNDDDDDGYASRREYREQKGKRIKLGPVKLVRGGGWCDYCNAATDGPV